MTESVKGVYSANKKIKSGFKFNVKAANCLVCLFIAAIGVCYLTTVNDLIVKSFVLQDLKNRSSYLEEESQNLGNQVAEVKSYNELAKRVDKLGMVSAANIQYFKASNNSLAVR